MALEVVAQGEHGDGGRHLALHADGHLQHELAALLHGAGLEHELLVAVRAGGQVAQGGDGVALHLLGLGGPQQRDERAQEAGVDDGRLVERVDADVADAGHGREHERQVRGAQQRQQRRQPARPHDLELVLLVRGQVAQGQRGLALHLGLRRLRVHELHQRLHQPRLRLRQPLAVAGVDGDVGQRRGAVVLHVHVGREQQLHQHGDGPRQHQLPPVLVRVRHVEQRARRVALHPRILGLGQARQRTQRARPRDLGLVVLVRGQVRDAADGVALHLHIGRHHLPD